MTMNRKGFSVLFILLASALIIIVFVLLMMQGSEKTSVSINDEIIMKSQETVSDFSDVDSLERELDETMVGTPELELDQLDSDASTL